MAHCYLFMGPSGSGKTTLAKGCFAPEQKVVSYTTRAPREGEVEGLDYFFVSEEVFSEMVAKKQFAETDRYDDNRYGIAKRTIQDALAKGDCYDPITPRGFFHLYRLFGDAMVPVWINVSKETVQKRLAQRMDPQETQRRLALFEKDQQAVNELKILPTLIEIDGEQSIDQMIQAFSAALIS